MSEFKVTKENAKMETPLDWLLLLLIFGAITVIINFFSYKNPVLESLPGMLILIGITFAGMLLAKFLPFKIPAMIYISLIALIISLPCFGGLAEFVFNATGKINTLGLCTAILAYSGVAVAKSWAEFRKMGWRSIVVTLCVIVGTFLGSAIVAQIILKMQGII